MVDEESAGDSLLSLSDDQAKKEEASELVQVIEEASEVIQAPVETPAPEQKNKAPAKKRRAKKIKPQEDKPVDFAVLDGIRRNFTQILSTQPERHVMFMLSQTKFKDLFEDMAAVCQNRGKSTLILPVKESTEKNKAELAKEVQRFATIVVDDPQLAYKLHGAIGGSRQVLLNGHTTGIYQKTVDNVYTLLEKI